MWANAVTWARENPAIAALAVVSAGPIAVFGIFGILAFTSIIAPLLLTAALFAAVSTFPPKND